MRRIPRVIVLAAATLVATTPSALSQRGDCQGREPGGWSARIAGEKEPGTRLIISGRVLSAAGQPLSGMTVFVFHTDDRGYYSEGGMDEGNARLCGLALTDEAGRYRFETIRPAHYATGGPPAHVHYRVWGPGISRQGFTLHFEGDPKLGSAGEDASGNTTWARIRPVEEDGDGVLHVTRDLRLRISG